MVHKGELVYEGAIDDDPYGEKESREEFVENFLKGLEKGESLEAQETKPYGCSVKYSGWFQDLSLKLFSGLEKCYTAFSSLS